MSETSFAGRFVWRELHTTDVERAKSFYGELFGWSFKDVDMGEAGTYTVAQLGDKDVAGLMAQQNPGAPSMWLDYITVDDLDASLSALEGAGGSILMPARSMPGVGRFAIVADDTGGVFGPYRGEEPGTTDTDTPPAELTFCWSQLMARDLDAAKAFYTKLFPWTAAEMPGPMKTLLFSRGEKMIASAMAMPPEAGDAPTHWLQYVAVADTDQFTAQALTLGATQYKEPTTIPDMGRFAVFADPTGASFALWQDLMAAG